MIKKIFVAFELDKAVSDVNRLEVEYSSYQFTLSIENCFNTEKEAEEFIINKMNDYQKRGYEKGARFIILHVYVFDSDKQFTIK